MTLVIVSVTGHMVVAGINNYLLPPIVYSLCLQQAPQLAMVLYLAGDSNLPS